MTDWASTLQSLRAAARHEQAARLCSEWAQADPRSFVAEHNLASVLGDLSDFRGAAEASARALEKGSRAPETWLVRARALQGMVALDEAENAFEEAIARRPDYVDAHRDLAQLRWMRTSDFKEAVRTLDRALGDGRGGGELLGVRLTVLRSAGQAGEAERQLLDALARYPDDTALLKLAPQIHAEAGQAGRQLEAALRFQRSDPKSPVAAKLLVEALLHAGRFAEAVDWAQRLVSAIPADRGAVALLATAWRATGDPRHVELCELPALISSAAIEVPPGWSTLDAFLGSLASELDRRHVWVSHPLSQSVRHGSQTQDDLTRVTTPVVRALFAALDSPIRSYIADLRAAHGGQGTSDYRFAGAWSVRLRPGGFHTDHVHPRGWISAAFHVALPDAVERGREGWLAFGRPGIPVAARLDPFRYLKPKPGHLVLFPSYLWHGTESFSGKQDRLSVAFDLVPA